jgi:hypothetical protein
VNGYLDVTESILGLFKTFYGQMNHIFLKTAFLINTIIISGQLKILSLCILVHISFGINLWAGVIDNNLVGPFTLLARVNAENFLQFLQNDFQVLLEDLPLAILRQMWLQLMVPLHILVG